MSKNAKYRAKRAERPKVVQAQAATAQEQANRNALWLVASASANQHSTQLEYALSDLFDAAEESGVPTWGDLDRRPVAVLATVLTAEIDPDAPAASRIAQAADQVLTHKLGIERLTGERVIL